MILKSDKTFKIKAEIENISALIENVRINLIANGLTKKEAYKACISIEDVVAMMIDKAAENTNLKLTVSKFLGDVSVRITCKGEEFSMEDVNAQLLEGLDSDDEAKSIMLKLMGKTMQKKINLSNKLGINICDIIVKESPQKMLYYIMGSLVGGIVGGALMKACLPADILKIISDYILGPVVTMFLNALKTAVAPLVFFSIATSISGYTDLKSLGKVAMKVMGCYIFTSMIAISIGYGIYQLFPIGDTSLAGAITESTISQNAAKAEVSIKDTIINIIPSDIISPFLHMDMLQIIFLAILVGIATSMMANEDNTFAKLLICCNRAFSKIINIIMIFIPLAVFCSMAKMVVAMNLSAIIKMAVWIPVCYAGHALMIGAYLILLVIMSGYNPMKFIKGFMPAMLTAFSTGSSSVTMPVSLKSCKEGLKISPKIYSFSIPLGATVNMDGTCVVLMITSLFVASIFQIPVTGDMIVSLIIAIMALSMGAPAVPGGALICMAVLFPIIGAPAEAVSLFIGIYPIVGRSLTMTNVTGDAVVTTIVAKSEKMIALDK